MKRLRIFVVAAAASVDRRRAAAFLPVRSHPSLLRPGSDAQLRGLFEQADLTSQDTGGSSGRGAPTFNDDPYLDDASNLSDRARYFLGTSGFRSVVSEDERRAATKAVEAAERVDRSRLLEERARLNEMVMMIGRDLEEQGKNDPVKDGGERIPLEMSEEATPIGAAADEADETANAEANTLNEGGESARETLGDDERKALEEANHAVEAKRKAEAEEARRAAEEEKSRKRAEEEEKAKEEAEAEAEAKRKREEEAEAEAEEKRKREEEEAARKAEEEEGAQRRAAEEEAARKAAAEAAAAAAAAEEEANRRAVEDAKLLPLKDRATGIEFQPKLGDDLYLLGVGVRKKAIINVYSVGAYSSYEAKSSLSSESAKSDRKAALSALRSAAQSSPTAFLLEMAFKAGADAMASAIAESVAPRHRGEKSAVEELKVLIFDGVKAKGGTATKGTTILFECRPGEGVGVSVDGTLVGEVQSDDLGAAFCEVFLDDKAVSPALRDNCLQNCCGV